MLDGGQFELFFEYLDAKRYPHASHLELMGNVIRSKYQNQSLDLIISVDNIAYDFFIQLRDEVFSSVPALAVGLNASVQNRVPNTGYIIENNDYRRNLDLATSMHPDARNIHIILDQTVTGRIIRGQLEEIFSSGEYPPPVWIDSGGNDEILPRIAEIPAGDILMYILYFSDRGLPIDNAALLSAVCRQAQVPTYAFWSFAVPDGAMGGYVYDGFTLGRISAEQILEHFQAGDVSGLYIEEPLTRGVIDYPTARRFGLDIPDFPSDLEFLRRPESFLRRNALVLSISAGVIASLVVIIVLIQLNLRRQQAINRFNQNLLDTQREIMFNLGNVIERRSRETSDHLKRISFMSRFLAKKIGISKQDLQILSFGAALHDVGKVGIPDEILKKSGKLSAKELAVIRRHPEIGWEILGSSNNELIRKAAIVVHQHHESWDGSGYPRGLSGRDISILARLVTISDVIDALLSERNYKRAWEPDEVKAYILKHSGTIFDPDLVNIAIQSWDELYKIWRRSGQVLSHE